MILNTCVRIVKVSPKIQSEHTLHLPTDVRGGFEVVPVGHVYGRYMLGQGQRSETQPCCSSWS